MDEKVETFKPTITSFGVAGLWLQQHIPTADRKMADSLGNVIETMAVEGIIKGIQNSIETFQNSPDAGAAIASLEADLIELEHAAERRRAESNKF